MQTPSNAPAIRAEPRRALLVDLGSTFTKVTLIDLAGCRLEGSAQAPTTVGDVMQGLLEAVRALPTAVDLGRIPILASSSAAGGLRMVAIGLVPDLTAEAARQAALGAGARVERVFSYDIGLSDIGEIEQLAPDIVLLAGGTDGGNSKTILGNAARLAASQLNAPIVVAGNRAVRDDVCAILAKAGKEVVVTDNVLATVEHLNIEPARAAIRELFMRRITKAKGMDAAEKLVGRVVMPTPMAVLEAARLLAIGVEGESGLGPVVIVDVGGATTDIHSVAANEPADPTYMLKGLEEPVAKRTVEGDLGIRINAAHILHSIGEARICSMAPPGAAIEAADLALRVASGALSPAVLPNGGTEERIDAALARAAVDAAVGRHVGRIEIVFTAQGRMVVQYGKSLAHCKAVIGTGGIFVRGPYAGHALGGVAGDGTEPISLRPRNPELFVDRDYLLYAGGLLAQSEPLTALRLMKRHLARVK